MESQRYTEMFQSNPIKKELGRRKGNDKLVLNQSLGLSEI